jgi:Permeases of the drug/metabolite transporter (DMT) superfamily
MTFNLSKKRWQWASMLFLALTWGSSFILMKKGLQAFTDIQVAAIRVFFSFLILIPVFLRHIRKVNRQNIVHLAIVGYAGIFFPAFLFTLSETQITSSLAGMLNSLAPLFALIVGIMFYQSKPAKNQYIGIIIGLIGAIGLVSEGRLDFIKNVNLYGLYVVIATFGYGINANEVKFKLKGMNGIEITSLAFMLIGPPAGIILICTNLAEAYHSPHFWPSLAATLTLATFGSVLSLFIYNNLIRYTSALFATSVTYIVPVFAIFWGIADGETITLFAIFNIAVVLLGVWLVNRKKKQ